MGERLTEPALRVIVQAQEEARGLSHNYVGSEHLLLGLLAVRDGLAARALGSLGINLDLVRERVIETVGVGDQDSPAAIPLTPRARRLLSLALEEAVSHQAEHVGTEHLLLAVLDEDEAVAARVLRGLGLDLQHARVTAEQMPGAEPLPPVHGRGSRTREPRPRIREISADQAGSFAVLRRPQVETDRLPEDKLHMFEGGVMGLCGLNPALARRASTALGDLWVVPGNGYIALYDGSATCNLTAAAVHSGIVMWGSTRPHQQIFVHGLVPDGVGHVTLFAADGVSTTVAAAENAYGAILSGAFRLGRFDGPAGAVEFGPEAG